MHNSRPKIFISSTIYDFKDLRSTLKYWLEQLGYEVLLSEFNDFTKQLDENSYEACLQSISRCDYFILLIGARVGGYYNRTKKITITCMEYRKAYELAKFKRLKIVVFIRKELWTIREDRKALKSFLENEHATCKEISIDKIKKIINYSSELINEPEVIFRFINEVSRTEEMKKAIEGKGLLPVGNWIHPYSTFKDIVDVLRLELNINDRLGRVALSENLKHELYSNLIQLTEKYKEKIKPSYLWASFARKHLIGNFKSSSQMPGRYLRRLIIYLVGRNVGNKLSTYFIDQALVSGEFLDYNPDLNKYQSGPINNALFDLRENINRLRFIGPSSQDELISFMIKYKNLSKTEENVSITNKDLVMPFAIADNEQNIVILSVALIKALDGDTTKLSNFKLNPTTPLIAEAEMIKNETPSLEDVAKWINEQ